MTNVWLAQPVEDPAPAAIALGHFIRLPEGQHTDVESDFLTSHLPFRAGALAGLYYDGNPWLFVVQQAPPGASALAGEPDPYWVMRDSLDQALSYNVGVEVTFELRFTRDFLIDAYRQRGVGRKQLRGWPVAPQLRGLLAECCNVPLSDIVAGYASGCAFPGVDHACPGDVFSDVGARWAASQIPQPDGPDADDDTPNWRYGGDIEHGQHVTAERTGAGQKSRQDDPDTLCPRCGQSTVLPILWGMPFEDPGPGVIMGGCEPSPAEYGCPACGWRDGEFGHDDPEPDTDLLLRFPVIGAVTSSAGIPGVDFAYQNRATWRELKAIMRPKEYAALRKSVKKAVGPLKTRKPSDPR